MKGPPASPHQAWSTHLTRTLAGLLLAAGLLPAVQAQVQTPAPAQPQDTPAEAAEKGRKLYISGCQRCHGINLVSNGIGFDLRTFPAQEKERFVRGVNNGLRAMPAWSGSLKPEQVDLIWLYMGSVNGWPAPAAAAVAGR